MFKRPTGKQYTGEWLQGKYHGQGKLVLSNHDSFIGNFRFGKYEGYGCLSIHESGETYTGMFEGGQKVSEINFIR